MYRRLILGGFAAATVIVAKRQFGHIGSDIKRYNTMRAMSGDPPLARQGFGMLIGYVKSLGKKQRPVSIPLANAKSQRPALFELATAMQNDLIRYMRMRAM